MTRGRLAAAVVVLVVVLATAVVALASDDGGSAASDEAALVDLEATSTGRVAGMGPQGRVPQFKVECGWSHPATAEPIVHHGHPGRSHLSSEESRVGKDGVRTVKSRW